MLRKAMVAIIVLLIASPCFAQTMEDVVNEYGQLGNEIKELQNQISIRQRRMIELEGVAKYLNDKNEQSKIPDGYIVPAQGKEIISEENEGTE